MSPEPYLELTCSDCGEVYTAGEGDCPRCGGANASYDSVAARLYMEDWDERDRERRDAP